MEIHLNKGGRMYLDFLVKIPDAPGKLIFLMGAGYTCNE